MMNRIYTILATDLELDKVESTIKKHENEISDWDKTRSFKCGYNNDTTVYYYIVVTTDDVFDMLNEEIGGNRIY